MRRRSPEIRKVVFVTGCAISGCVLHNIRRDLGAAAGADSGQRTAEDRRPYFQHCFRRAGTQGNCDPY